MKKIICIIIILGAAVLISTAGAFAAEEQKDFDDGVNEQLDFLDTKELEEYLKALSDREKELFGGNSFKEKIQTIISGDFKLSYDNIFQAVFGLFFDDIFDYLPVFSSIAAICILCGIVTQLKPSFLSDGTANIIFLTAYCSVLILILTSVFGLYGSVIDCINNLKTQMDISFPVMLTLMAASGGSSSVSVYRPAAAFLSNGIVKIFFSVVLPVSGLILVFSVIGNMSENVKLNKFIDFFKSINKWVIGFSLTVFTVFLSIQGMTSASYDGISFRAAKYAIGNSVPIVGGFLKDGLDLILASSMIIKNAVGSGCIILLVCTIVVPLIKIAAYSLFLKLTAAVIEPVGDSRTASLLAALSTGINYLTAALLAVAFMYFISVMMLVSSSSSFF